MDRLNDTTRCYPRTLLEAFPQDAKNWEFMDCPNKRITFWGAVMWAISIVVCVFFLWYWTTK
jgi:hypothetical protein